MTASLPMTATASTATERAALERELAQELGVELGLEPGASGSASSPTEAAIPPSAPARPAVRLIDVAFDLLVAGGTSSAQESALRALEAGGHDPKNRGFTLQNTELTFSGVVDPYLRGDANIVLQIDEDGETAIELEEAYLTTLSLPGHLQLKGGHFYNAFGRQNAVHPHGWEFVDAPVVSTRLLGPDGLRNPGLQVSWLTPLPFFLELTASVQNARGETAASFSGVAGEELAGRPLRDFDVRSLLDFVYLARLRTSFDPTEALTLVLGFSGLYGPNATGRDAQTQIFGADLYAKWKPLTSVQGWPFFAWQTEAMVRRYEVASLVLGRADGLATDDVTAVPGDVLDDWGLYTQLVVGLWRPWVVAVRYDYAAGQESDFDLASLGLDRAYATREDSTRDRRHRFSAALTYYPTEFSKVRLQYAHDRAAFLEPGSANSVYLQAEITFGAHGAHAF
ncbi:MAG: TonB-dependent receptor [Deltaproteobacteria bacterium]|nr:TonB-dependent receptor [Deltaproteobacteria bacterium]